MENASSAGSAANEELHVYTLGQLVVARKAHLLSEEYRQARKLWLLFSYLVVHQDRSISSEELIDMLWSEFDKNIDPEHALRNMIYRLRHLLNKNSMPAETRQHILYNRGVYRWNTDYICHVDIKTFDSLVEDADRAASESKEQAVKLFMKAVGLYRGIFLPEFTDYGWVISLRSFYRKRYIDTVIKLSELLISQGKNPETADIFEKAMLMEPFEEKLHLGYLNFLIDEGDFLQAQAHYQFVTSLFYKELGIKPSISLQNIYSRIKSSEENSVPFNSQPGKYIREHFNDAEECDGVIDCKAEALPFFRQLKENRSFRTGHSLHFIMFTLTGSDNKTDYRELKHGMQLLKEILVEQLRKGDVISHWNDNQYIALLSGVSKEQGESVIKRVESQFKEKYNIEKLRLNSHISKAVINK